MQESIIVADKRFITSSAPLTGCSERIRTMCDPITYQNPNETIVRRAFPAQDFYLKFPDLTVTYGDDGISPLGKGPMRLWGIFLAGLIPDLIGSMKEEIAIGASNASAAAAAMSTANAAAAVNDVQNARLSDIESKNSSQDAALLQIKTKLSILGIIITL